jgi:hypothetical protein
MKTKNKISKSLMNAIEAITMLTPALSLMPYQLRTPSSAITTSVMISTYGAIRGMTVSK